MNRLILLALSLPALLGCTALECTQVGCGWEASFDTDLPPSMTFEEMRQLRFRMCRNAVCYEGTAEPFTAEEIENGRSFFLDEIAEDTEHEHGVYVEIRRRYDTTQHHVTLNWTGRVADGDDYVVEIEQADTGYAVSVENLDVTYERSYPNGPDCDSGCLHVDLGTN